MAWRYLLRRDTAANWSSVNPVLALGEPGFDETAKQLKMGDGISAWNDLAYATDVAGGAAAALAAAEAYVDGKVSAEVTRADGTYVAAADISNDASTVRQSLSQGLADEVAAGTSAFAVAQKAAFVPPTARGGRIVWLGDSITQGATDYVNQAFGQSYPMMTQLALAGRGMTVHNAGISGNTSAQMLARFDTDVTPYAPNVVPLLAGTNDIGNGVGSTPFSTFQANIRALVAKIRGIGAMPVLATIPPNNNDPTHTAPTWNLWLTRYAASIGAPLIDLHAVLVDPATGNYKAGWTDDGTHPNPVGQQPMGVAAAAVLSTVLNPWSVPLVHSNGDTAQLLGTNPLFTADSNSDGVPDQWGTYGGGGSVISLVTDTKVLGKMVQIARTTANDVQIVTRNITAGFAAGDTLAFAGVITSDGGLFVSVQLSFNGASKSAFPTEFQGAVTRGVWYGEFVVPAGTTSIDVNVNAGSGGGTGQTGTVAFGQPTLYNLTALGLA